MGLSPNIVDNPYSGSISLWQFYRNGRGRADIGISASRASGDTTTWPPFGGTTQHPPLGHAARHPAGKRSDWGSHRYFFNVYTGSGKVRIDLQPTNRGAFLTLGASNCSDVFTVR